MKKRIFKIFLTLILISFVSFSVNPILINVKRVRADCNMPGWLDDWIYRLPIVLVNESDEDYSSLSYKLEIGKLPVDTYLFWDNVREDAKDIRLTEGDGETKIPYWIEYWNKDKKKAIIWVYINQLNRNEHKTIYLYFKHKDPDSLDPENEDISPTYAPGKKIKWHTCKSNKYITIDGVKYNCNKWDEDIQYSGWWAGNGFAVFPVFDDFEEDSFTYSWWTGHHLKYWDFDTSQTLFADNTAVLDYNGAAYIFADARFMGSWGWIKSKSYANSNDNLVMEARCYVEDAWRKRSAIMRMRMIGYSYDTDFGVKEDDSLSKHCDPEFFWGNEWDEWTNIKVPNAEALKYKLTILDNRYIWEVTDSSGNLKFSGESNVTKIGDEVHAYFQFGDLDSRSREGSLAIDYVFIYKYYKKVIPYSLSVEGIFDFSVSKTSNPTKIYNGGEITFTLVLKNKASVEATNIVVKDRFFSHFDYDLSSIYVSTGDYWISYPDGDKTIVWHIPSIGPCSQETMTITGTANGIGKIVNHAWIEPDSRTHNNSDDRCYLEVVVYGRANLSISEFSDSPDPVIAGEELTYTIGIKNNGPDPAENVKVCDHPDYPFPQEVENPTFKYSTDGGNTWIDGGNWNGDFTFEESLPKDSTFYIKITGRVNHSTEKGKSLKYKVKISSPTPRVGGDPDEGQTLESDEIQTTVDTRADLMVEKRNLFDTVPKGKSIIYIIKVTNNGPSDAQNVNINDALPSEIENAVFRYSTDGGETWEELDNNSWTGSYTFKDSDSNSIPLYPGLSFYIKIKGTVKSSASTGDIENTASVSSDTEDPESGNNTDTEQTTIIESDVFAIDKIDSVDPVIAGKTLTYTISVINYSNDDQSDVEITDSLPKDEIEEPKYRYRTSSDGGYEWDSGWSNWESWSGSYNITTLASGEVFQLQIRGKVKPSVLEGSTIRNTAYVTKTNDSYTSDNDDTEETGVITRADLEIEKSGPDEAIAGKENGLTYTITITNNGPSDAQKVEVSDPLPPEIKDATFEYSEDGTNWTDGGDWNGSYTFLDSNSNSIPLHPGSYFYIRITGTVDPSTGNNSTITNTASVSSDTEDTNPSNNSDSWDTRVIAEADLEISKEDDPDPVVANHVLKYTITVKNNGPSHAVNVKITDDPPLNDPEFYYSTDGTNYTDGGPWTGSYTLSDPLPDGSNLYIRIEGKAKFPDSPSPIAQLENTVEVTSDTFDPNLDNNQYIETTTVIKEDLLMLKKEDSEDPIEAL